MMARGAHVNTPTTTSRTRAALGLTMAINVRGNVREKREGEGGWRRVEEGRGNTHNSSVPNLRNTI